MGPGALTTYAPEERGAIRELWRWRGGVGPAVTTARGGKVSEDIVVPMEHLAEGILATREIGRRHDLPACSWGHAGDGNLHSTFMVDPEDEAEAERAEAGVQELYALAASLGGSVSGEHGLGVAKRGALALQWPDAGARSARVDQAPVRPQGPAQPGEEAGAAGERLVGVGPARRQEREQLQPVAALVEVQVGDQDRRAVARRLDQHAPVGV